jgi:hypothetical protein
MTLQITAKLTRCRNNQALVVLDSEPFNGMDIRPHELRTMAQQLIALADMANKLPLGGKHFKPTTVQLGGASAKAAVDFLNPSDVSVFVNNAIFGAQRTPVGDVLEAVIRGCMKATARASEST